MAFSMTQESPFPATQFFPLFGLVFIGLGIFQAIYHYKNATGKNRMSVIDIVDSDEEPDPLHIKFSGEKRKSSSHHEHSYCPYCGHPVQSDFNFCPTCGKHI